MPLPKVLEKIQSGDMTMVLQLIYSMTSDRKTGKILGEKFFAPYDELEIIEYLSDPIMQLVGKSIPEAKNQTEKK